MVTQRIRDYELIVVLSPQANDEEVTATIERFDSLITEKGGELSEQEDWGVRRLAYPIQDFSEGNYVLKRFKSDPQTAVELGHAILASENILRHLITKM